MTKHYCDICGKEMQSNTVINENSPLDCRYGECRIDFNVGLQGIYEVGFEEICHECQQKISCIDMDDFHDMLIENLMGIKRGYKQRKDGADNE